MTGLKRKVGVKNVIGTIPRMETTYVRCFEKFCTFSLYLERAVICCVVWLLSAFFTVNTKFNEGLILQKNKIN